jgi:large-conductance mechanosensitive channel
MKFSHAMVLFVGGIAIGALLGSIALAFAASRNASHLQASMGGISFSEFTGFLLGCIAIIMTAFGVFLAILGIYGFNAIEDKAVKEASAAAVEEAKNSLQDGGELRTYITEVVHSLTNDLVNKSFSEGGAAFKLTEQLVRNHLYRGAGLDESSGANDPEESD